MSTDEIRFGKEERAALVRTIQGYFRDELDQELGQFQAGFLLDFFSEEIGPHYYNRALLDAQAVVELRVDAINEAIDGLSKTGSSRTGSSKTGSSKTGSSGR